MRLILLYFTLWTVFHGNDLSVVLKPFIGLMDYKLLPCCTYTMENERKINMDIYSEQFNISSIIYFNFLLLFSRY